MVDDADFYKEAHNFTKNALHLLQDSFGFNGLDCMILTSTGSLLVTNDGHDIIKSLSVKCPVGKYLYQNLGCFYQKTGDFSKKYILLLSEMMHEISEELQQSKLQIKNGFKHILFHVLPEIFDDFKMMPLELKSTDETVLCILKTCFSGKFNELTSNKLTRLLRDLIFDHSCTDVGDLAIKVSTMVDKFQDIFWEVPGSSVMTSTLLNGILLPRDFSTSTCILNTSPFKFLVLGTSLGSEQPQSATRLDLKDSVTVTKFCEWQTIYMKKVFHKFSSLGIKLILCSKSFSETAVHFCNHYEMAGVQYLPTEDMCRVCDLFEINPMFEIMLDDDMTPFIAEATLCKTIGTGQSTYVYLEGDIGPLGKQVLLYAPTEAMCGEYSKAIKNALKVLKHSFRENQDGQQMLSILPGGGAFEFKMIHLLDTYKKNHNLSTCVETSLDILRKALVSIPRQLLSNKSTFCTVMAQATTLMKCSDNTFVSLNKKGCLCGDSEVDTVEPLLSNFHLLTSVIQVLVQILRTDKILHVRKLPTTTHDT